MVAGGRPAGQTVAMEIEIEQVDPQRAAELVAAGAALVDVREPDEWEAGHAPAAVHVPLGSLGDRLGKLPGDRTLVMVCRSGGRSQAAATALVGAGFAAVNLAGGMQAWQAAGLPVETDAGSVGTVA